MFSRITLAVCVTVVAVLAQSKPALPVMPYDSLMDDRVSVDGYIDLEENEYPASFTNAATGLTVYWGYDSEFVYVGVSGKGKGWMAIGFGSPQMHEANMFIGYYSDDSAGVLNHVGRNYAHAAPAGNDSLLEEADIDYDDETGATAMEFIYPRQWTGVKGAAVSGLQPGDIYDLILARNAKTASLGQKHGQKAQLQFRLAEMPMPTPPPAGGK